MKQFEFYFKSYDKKCLFSQCWCPDEQPKVVIILLHDVGEHCGRYEKWAKQFVDNQIAVLTMDYRGHGKSDGKKGYIDHFDQLIKDTILLILRSEKEYPSIPKIIYGQGLGGNIALTYALKNKYAFAGSIATSPWLKPSRKTNNVYITYSKFLKRYLPKFSFKYILNVSNLTNNPSALGNYFNDPLNHNRLTSRLLREIQDSGKYLISRKYKINIPTLVMHGKDDNITSPNETVKFAQNSNHIQVKIWQDKFHELHNDVSNSEVFDYIINWINSAIIQENDTIFEY
ncbi:alpha/beta hydrolase [Bacteroidota bacterium]